MSTVANPVTEQASVRDVAEQLIENYCVTKGVHRSTLQPGQIEAAYDAARAKITEDRQLADNPFHSLYQQEKQQREQLERELTALKKNDGRRSQPDETFTTLEMVRSHVSAFDWARYPREDKFKALGVENVPSDAELKQLFGKGANSRAQLELSKANPKRYRQLRECAKALELYGG